MTTTDRSTSAYIETIRAKNIAAGVVKNGQPGNSSALLGLILSNIESVLDGGGGEPVNLTFTSTGIPLPATYTVPAGITLLTYVLCGGGGGGTPPPAGGSTGGAGGSSGGFISSTVVVAPGDIITITLGLGGLSGSAGETTALFKNNVSVGIAIYGDTGTVISGTINGAIGQSNTGGGGGGGGSNGGSPGAGGAGANGAGNGSTGTLVGGKGGDGFYSLVFS